MSSVALYGHSHAKTLPRILPSRFIMSYLQLSEHQIPYIQIKDQDFFTIMRKYLSDMVINMSRTNPYYRHEMASAKDLM